MEVDLTKEPGAGEVLVFTIGGGFLVKGSMLEIAQRLAGEEWPTLELAETNDKVILRSAHVVGLREGRPHHRSAIGFVHREEGS